MYTLHKTKEKYMLGNLVENLFNVELGPAVGTIFDLIFRKKEKIFGVYIEEYAHPNEQRAFSICIVYRDHVDKEIKCEGINFDENVKPNYHWTTLASTFENNILTYSYISLPYMSKSQTAARVGSGSLNLFPSAKSFISGDFTDSASDTVRFSVKRITDYCSGKDVLKLDENSSPELLLKTAKRVAEKIKITSLISLPAFSICNSLSHSSLSYCTIFHK